MRALSSPAVRDAARMTEEDAAEPRRHFSISPPSRLNVPPLRRAGQPFRVRDRNISQLPHIEPQCLAAHQEPRVTEILPPSRDRQFTKFAKGKGAARGGHAVLTCDRLR